FLLICFVSVLTPPVTTPLSLHDALPILRGVHQRQRLIGGVVQRHGTDRHLQRTDSLPVQNVDGLGDEVLDSDINESGHHLPPLTPDRRSPRRSGGFVRSEEHTSELQSREYP